MVISAITMVATRSSAGCNIARKNTQKRVGCEKKFTNKGAWSKQEDQKLIDYIQKHGEGCWSSLPRSAGLLRCGKSCRLRWVNYLKPDVKRGNFGEDEDDLIIKLHALLGNRWSLIAGRLPGRTDNEVKNYWNSHLKKKLMRMGIDADNHRLGGTALGISKSSDQPKAPAFNPLISPAENDPVLLDSPCGSASKATTSNLPDLNLNLNVEVDEDMHLQAESDSQIAPFTTLLLFG